MVTLSWYLVVVAVWLNISSDTLLARMIVCLMTIEFSVLNTTKTIKYVVIVGSKWYYSNKVRAKCLMLLRQAWEGENNEHP